MHLRPALRGQRGGRRRARVRTTAVHAKGAESPCIPLSLCCLVAWVAGAAVAAAVVAVGAAAVIVVRCIMVRTALLCGAMGCLVRLVLGTLC